MCAVTTFHILHQIDRRLHVSHEGCHCHKPQDQPFAFCEPVDTARIFWTGYSASTWSLLESSLIKWGLAKKNRNNASPDTQEGLFLNSPKYIGAVYLRVMVSKIDKRVGKAITVLRKLDSFRSHNTEAFKHHSRFSNQSFLRSLCGLGLWVMTERVLYKWLRWDFSKVDGVTLRGIHKPTNVEPFFRIYWDPSCSVRLHDRNAQERLARRPLMAPPTRKWPRGHPKDEGGVTIFLILPVSVLVLIQQHYQRFMKTVKYFKI